MVIVANLLSKSCPQVIVLNSSDQVIRNVGHERAVDIDGDQFDNTDIDEV